MHDNTCQPHQSHGTQSPVWKISIHWAGCPPKLMHWTWHIAVPGLWRTVPNLVHNKLCQIYCVCLRKIFCWPFLSYFTIILTFVATYKILFTSLASFIIFVDFFATLAIFLTFLGSHQSHVPRFPCVPRIPQPSCAEFGASHITLDAPEILGAITLLCRTYFCCDSTKDCN